MNFMDEVSKRIVELREAKGETQQQLADAIGITRQSLSRYEIAARTINVDVLGALAKHFEVSADYILGLSDVKSTEQDIKIVKQVTGLTENAILKLKEDKATAWAVDVLICSSVQNEDCGETETSPIQLISQYLFSPLVSEDIIKELAQLELNKDTDISREKANEVAKSMFDYFTEEKTFDRIKRTLKFLRVAIAHSETINKNLEVTDNAQHHETQE